MNSFLAVPYWSLVSNLESLSLSQHDARYYTAEFKVEQTEESITSFKLPVEPPSALTREGDEARDELNCAVINRTIVAAARTGNLRLWNATRMTLLLQCVLCCRAGCAWSTGK